MHQVDKSLKDLGEKVDPALRGQVESALGDVKTAMAADDKEAIDRKAEALSAVAATLAQASASAGASAGGADTGAQDSGSKHGDDVVDADFEEVRNKDRKP